MSRRPSVARASLGNGRRKKSLGGFAGRGTSKKTRNGPSFSHLTPSKGGYAFPTGRHVLSGPHTRPARQSFVAAQLALASFSPPAPHVPKKPEKLQRSGGLQTASAVQAAPSATVPP